MAMSDNLFRRILRCIDPTRVAAEAVDGRSHRFVAVIDCILNQNARDAGAARFPAMNIELLQLCHEQQVGVLQMPCPEIAALGIKRAREPGQGIRAALDTCEGRRRCDELAAEIVGRIVAYCAEGYEFIGIVGGNPQSPGCAVHHDQFSSPALTGESGLFMQSLQAEFGKRGIAARFMAIRDHDPAQLAEDMCSLREVFRLPTH